MAYSEGKMLIKELIDFFQSKGLRIKCADYEGYNECKRIKEFVPDIIARDTETEISYIGEAKTCDDVDSQESRARYQNFSDLLMTSGLSKGKPVPLYVITPEKCISSLIRIMQELGLSGKEHIHCLKG